MGVHISKIHGLQTSFKKDESHIPCSQLMTLSNKEIKFKTWSELEKKKNTEDENNGRTRLQAEMNNLKAMKCPKYMIFILSKSSQYEISCYWHP